MKRKSEVLKDIKTIRFEFHARFVLSDKQSEKEKIKEIMTLIDKITKKVEDLEEK